MTIDDDDDDDDDDGSGGGDIDDKYISPLYMTTFPYL
jgi:hypothetical protein